MGVLLTPFFLYENVSSRNAKIIGGTFMNYELIKFENGGLELEVNVSPEEETVWLTLNEMCLLFGRDKSVISRHIKNIFKEGELDEEQVIAKNATTAKDGKTYGVTFYNLDVIISVGYRVKSKNGVLFRKWANSILKQYLIKGYALNEERAVITKENYLGLLCRVDSMEYRLTKVEEKEKHLFVEDKMFLDGEMFDAIVVMTRLIETAKTSIVMIDPYTDVRTLDILKYKNKYIPLLLIMSGLSRIQSADKEIFIEKYGHFETRIDSRYHDRYLIIDDELFYHIGTSLNYIGKRVTQITIVQDDGIKDLLRGRIKEVL